MKGTWNQNMNSILKLIKENLNKNILFTNEKDVYFLTRFKSTNLSVFLLNGDWYAMTDPRYIEAAKKNILWMKVIDSSVKGWFQKILEDHKINEIFLSEGNTTILQLKNFKKLFDKYGISVKTFDYGNIRGNYNDQDIALLRESSLINDNIMNEIKKEIRVGMSEKEVSNIILKKIIDSKADRPSFDPIVASGISGSNPHWESSEKIINKNEMVTIDIGVYYKGMASDMTRTFIVKGEVSAEENKIWEIVNNAMEVTISMIKPGMLCSELHNKSIKIISEKGYGKYFTHSLGHGLGVDVHDSPNISKYSTELLKAGMIITIEPGIYIPGKYGVRLEQAVLVTKDSYEVLNKEENRIFI